jgi:type III restriction enzyme
MGKKIKKAKLSVSNSIIDLEQKLPEVPNRDPFSAPTMYLEKDGHGSYNIKPERRRSNTLLVNQLRTEVDKWRESEYKVPTGISDTSLRYLEWLFDETHTFENGEEFKFYFAQREAIETIIYLYEVKKIRDAADLVLTYMDEKAYGDDLFAERKKIQNDARENRKLVRTVPQTGQVAQQDLPDQDHYRYAVKMATGSGKTIVMAMAIVWSYFHKRFEKNSPLSRSFLVIAPNVIVYERLKEDFENGKIFTKWDMIPSEWKHGWQITCILRGETRKSTTWGTLYLTNIQQLYGRKENEEDTDPVSRLLGLKPKAAIGSWEEDISDRIMKHDDLMIINDEAHHVHDIELEWYKVILGFKNNLKEKFSSQLSLHLDFTATPKDQNGTYFPWIICDYPLAQAIEDRIVKAPLIVHKTDKADPEKYSDASVAYAEWINIAIKRWKEHYNAYGKVKQKPVLFIMAENTKDADDIASHLEGYSEFKDPRSILVIHTDKAGEISKKDLELAREAARSIDLPDNKIKVIVSVLMLREGWDVKNVSVILGLRPFTAKSNILPEQGIGRGLRLMSNIGPDYIQILEIIGTQKFEEFVKELDYEGVGVGVTRTSPSIGVHVYPVKIKEKYNIEIPVLSPIHFREFNGVDESILNNSKQNPLGLNISDGIINKVSLEEPVTQKVVAQKQIEIDTDSVPTSHEILTHITNRISKEARIDGHFNVIFPIVKKYISNIFFGERVNLDDERVRNKLCNSHNSQFIISALARRIGEKSITKTITTLGTECINLMETEGFYWRRDVYVECDKTIFNITPGFNDFEKNFAILLDKAKDIAKFVKLAETYTKFSIDYLNHKGAIAKYYPDFIAEQVTQSGSKTMWLIETKGWEQEDVALKDKRAEEWCKDVSRLTGTEWKYIKIRYADAYAKLCKYIEQKKITFNEFNDIISIRTTEKLL